MAGHSKWNNIKHRKQLVDSKRSKVFHKLTKELQNAAKIGTNVKTNAVLRTALAKAKTLNMPKDIIVKILKNAENDCNKKETYFWLAGCFAKVVFLFFKITGERNINNINEFKKHLQKTEIEFLPTTSSLHLFTEIFHVFLINISQLETEKIMELFILDDLEFVDETKELTLFFSDHEEIKKFQLYAQDHKMDIQNIQQTYLPKIRINLTTELKENFNFLCNKILNTTNCLLIADNLVK